MKRIEIHGMDNVMLCNKKNLKTVIKCLVNVNEMVTL